MYSAAARIGTWGLAAGGSAVVTGLGWAAEPVQIPLLWVLVLTFVPTSDLIDVARHQLDRLKKEPDTNE